MDNLAYTATTNNNMLEELAPQNHRGVTQGRSTAAPPPAAGRNRRNKQKINYEATDALMEPE
eukprot:4676768-Ditylum_brightwellii.AAC.1